MRLHQINRLRQFAPVAVTLGPPLSEERALLVEKVCNLADTTFVEETSTLQAMQLALL